jgi:membrane fusion protein, multidrug efflux system
MKFSFIILFFYTVLLTACNHTEHAKAEDAEYSVSSPIKIDTSINTEYVCQIRAINHIEIRSLERGYLQNIFVDEGQHIKKGQAMFQIMPLVYQAEMEKSKADVDYANIEFENTKILSDKNIVSVQELALSKAKLDREKADLKLSDTHLRLTRINAPFSGIMDKFRMRLGSLVEEGELLTELSDNSKLWVYFNVPESEYLNYATKIKKEGPQKVKLLMANNEIFSHDGNFETIEADFNNETGNIAFRATFPNPEGILRHGETGTILLPTYLKNTILIPQEATYDILDKKFVYVVNEKGIINSRQITVGIEMPHIYQVTAGLTDKDRILVDGLRKVKNGDHIKTKFKPYRTLINELVNLHAE